MRIYLYYALIIWGEEHKTNSSSPAGNSFVKRQSFKWERRGVIGAQLYFTADTGYHRHNKDMQATISISQAFRLL